MPKKSKKYVVRLADAERETLQQIVRKFKGTSQKVRRAQVLLKSDADGPDWTDAKIAEAFGCRGAEKGSLLNIYAEREDARRGDIMSSDPFRNSGRSQMRLFILN